MRTTKLLTTILLVMGCGNPTIVTPADSAIDTYEVATDQPIADSNADTLIEAETETDTGVDSPMTDSSIVDSETMPIVDSSTDTWEVAEDSAVDTVLDTEVAVDSSVPDTRVADTGVVDTGNPCIFQPGYLFCNGACRNPSNDRDHCGACNHPCMVGFPDGGIVYNCVRSVCQCTIVPGRTDLCSGSCTNLVNNNNSCGSCNNRCATGQRCNFNICVPI